MVMVSEGAERREQIAPDVGLRLVPDLPPVRRRRLPFRALVNAVDLLAVLTIIFALALVANTFVLNGRGSGWVRRSADVASSARRLVRSGLGLDESSRGASIAGDTPCPKPDGSQQRVVQFAHAPPRCIDVTKTFRASVVTNRGTITFTLDPYRAPITVNNFVTLARYHYFDSTVCHRIIVGQLVQCGDPSGTGSGGPGYVLTLEPPKDGHYRTGSLVMADAAANGGQFFIISGLRGESLPPSYSLFGQIDPGQIAVLDNFDAAGSDLGVPPRAELKITSVQIFES